MLEKKKNHFSEFKSQNGELNKPTILYSFYEIFKFATFILALTYSNTLLDSIRHLRFDANSSNRD